MDEQYKYIYWYFEDEEKNMQATEELINLREDPYEMVNLKDHADYQSELERMRMLYDQLLEDWKTEGVNYNGYEKYETLFDRTISRAEKQESLYLSFYAFWSILPKPRK